MSTPTTLNPAWNALHSLAPERFDAYVRPGSDELDAIARYIWNIEVSKALHPKLHALEVTFRNRLHNALTPLYGSAWYDHPGLLQANLAHKVSEAKQALTKDGRSHDPGRIVASLSFGFWTSLYGHKYDGSIGWRTIARVFPHYNGQKLTRAVIADRLNDARRLRNRISHCEPVAFNVALPRYHREICELLTWMHPEMASISDVGDDLRAVYGRTWRAYRPIAEELFG